MTTLYAELVDVVAQPVSAPRVAAPVTPAEIFKNSRRSNAMVYLLLMIT
jgi:hypothetical protein